MMDVADFLLLFFCAAVLGVGVVITHRTLRVDAVKVQKYQLYKVRDDLVYLIASGKVSERDFIFQMLYPAANYFITHIASINLKTVVRTLEDARTKGVDPATEENMKRLKAELNRIKDEDVIQAVVGFYQAIMEILVQNSWLLRLITRHTVFMSAITKFAQLTKKMRSRSTQRRAYWFYREYESGAHGALAH